MINFSSLAGQSRGWSRRGRGGLVVLMGCLAMGAPFVAGPLALALVGMLLIVCGILEWLAMFGATEEFSRRSTYLSGVLSILTGFLLIGQPRLVVGALAILLGASFLIDGLGKIIAGLGGRSGTWSRMGNLGGGLAICALSVVLFTGWPIAGFGVVEVVMGFRMLTAGWAMIISRADQGGVTPVLVPAGLHPDSGLGLPPQPRLAALDESLAIEEEGRRSIDAYWCWTFVAVFFAIHLGRMNVDWNLVGMLSPLGAVIGDVGTALFLSFAMILPCRLGWRKLTRPLERRAWNLTLARVDQGRGSGLRDWFFRGWLMNRLRFSRRMAQARQSPRAALRWGLQVGLPATAILIAVNPIWGFSWFFNSESWTTGIWDRWAEARTDHWREGMIEAIAEHYGHEDVPADRLFAVEPEGVAGNADFSFLVLGDTGEGGAAQHSLRDKYLFLGKRPDVKFLVISSDVIYPAGAMKDYEPNFYLPFKGFTKPIYAIPGNHDWYDALEGFAANFMKPAAARVAMRKRVDMDGRLTTTTEGRIDRSIKEAARLRQEFGVSNGWQHGPFFELQTERFALIAVDTGVLRQVDSRQWEWLKAALERAKGKFTMAILGHPLYAGGRYQAGPEDVLAGEWTPQPQLSSGDEAPFAAIHRLLKKHQVEVVMAGDTHYFEHYQEDYPADGKTRSMHHFVNGGGGAYTSIGTPLDWPKQPAVPKWTYFPRKDDLIAKMDSQMPVWKMPLWLWVKHFQAWPAKAETLAGAFHYSRAPFFQSFVEVQVAGSKNEVRLIPHGTNGRLRWRDLENYPAIMPPGFTADDEAAFIVPMKASRP